MGRLQPYIPAVALQETGHVFPALEASPISGRQGINSGPKHTPMHTLKVGGIIQKAGQNKMAQCY